MSELEIFAVFDDKTLEDYIIYNSVEVALQEQKELYSTIQFDVDSIPAKNFRFMFRFEKKDIITLHKALQMPQKFETTDRHVVGGIEGLCLFLRRFSYPNRLKELQNTFGLHYSSLSKLLSVVCQFIVDKWGKLLLNLRENKWFTNEFQNEIASIVQDKGAPLANCIGFIDGTARQICRLVKYQREMYSGHKRFHCLKFQNVTLPNGIIVHMSLPFCGRRHDAFLLRETGILEQLKLHCNGFCLYGDEGYPLKPQLIRPYSSVHLSEEQKEFNLKMAKLRECVEWSFGKIVQQFAFVDFSKNQKLFLQPVGQFYSAATLLTNAHTCFYGSETSTYFNIESPNVFEYFK